MDLLSLKLCGLDAGEKRPTGCERCDSTDEVVQVLGGGE